MPKRHIDAIDLAAEREASALVLHRTTVPRRIGQGKRIQRQRRAHMDGEKRIECRTVKQSFERIWYA